MGCWQRLVFGSCVMTVSCVGSPHPGLFDDGSLKPTTNQPDDFGVIPDDTDVTADTDVTDTASSTTSVQYSCDNLPPKPTTWTELNQMPTSEEFIFDDQGNMVNRSDAADGLVLTTYAGVGDFIVPYWSWEVAGIALMLDGDVALCDEAEGSLIRLGMDGSQGIVATGLSSPNSVTIDADGFVYVTAFDAIRRVDPTTGEYTEIVQLIGKDLDGLTFAPDFVKLYFNYDSGGEVGSIEIDAEGRGSNLHILASISAQWVELDGMTVDECGNIYVVQTDGVITRVSPEGLTETFLEITGGSLNTTALHFGSGIGGWKADHLYVMNRYAGLIEIDVGIGGKWEPHLPVPSP